MNNEKIGAVILAAGSSRRMGGKDKVFTELAGRSVLARVLDVFEESAAVDRIVVVLNRENLERGERLIRQGGWRKVAATCPGGPRRQDSVREGLERLHDCWWVAIHDGARPLVSAEIIERGVAEARAHGAAVAAVPLKDTVKMATGEGLVVETLPRESLWAVQTPQVFRFDLILEAHRRVVDDVTDDAGMVERLGHGVKLFMGSYQNIKLTTPEDVALAELILRNR